MFTVYKKFWTHYADFEGKSTRPEYWWSVLCNVLITLPFGMIAFGSILTAIFNIVQQAVYYREELGEFDLSVFIASLGSTFIIIILLSIFWIATLIPNLAIIVRRLRDAGYHWAFIFLYAGPILLMWVPILNILAAVAMLPCSIALIVLLCMPTKVQPMVYQGQFTAQQAKPQQQPVQAQQFTQPQEPVQEQAVEPETTPTQPQQESAITTETPEQVVQSDEKELDSAFSEDN
ncbi:DUF805 domain-containing protein [Streptococcus anginosus]|uniref:PF05656 family protein n=1 Tax=Streptococcus anginosus SK1138 TaxID=1161422 RepID=A0AAD2T6Q5_STRAP|nr:DUF805 domain-containing protein [Streptococcus anginosus]EJP24718.1 PF05656 family protein [Streptococcus anginosus SK1138]MCY7223222.1 DUF805 domain-containing protein [Streptococcus anginosus]RIB36927.1 DUF805 domain-containing protein [Streptococcus anginosus]